MDQQWQYAPSVGVITSWWASSAHDPANENELPHSIRTPLEEGIETIELYFAAHHEIPWFAKLSGQNDLTNINSPTEFAAKLNSRSIRNIAEKILGLISSRSDRCAFGVFGYLPRICAVATFFPDLSLPDGQSQDGETHNSERRKQAVKAMVNTGNLAHALGAKVVEFVGGAGVPETNSKKRIKTTDYREARLRALAGSLDEICGELSDTGVKLSIEIEPGPSFLLTSVQDYRDLVDMVKYETRQMLYLNIDCAHAFMLGIKASDLAPDLMIAHMHLSDHAAHTKQGGQHASDLVPGKFHSKGDYLAFVTKAFEALAQGSLHSRCISIELEACNDMDKVHFAVNAVKRWVAEIAHSNNAQRP